MKLAILSDFDDTAAQQNVAHLVLDRFSEVDWRPLLDKFRQGSIKPKDYFEMPFRPITAAKHDMQAYVRETARLRPGFPELADFCIGGGIELAVVTHGLDFYVEALLERANLQRLPTYAVGARFSNQGIEFEYRYTRESCTEWGNCKCSIVDSYRERGYQVYYAGDGISDYCPARRADFVFARSQLLDMCLKESLPSRELRDFFDVLDYLKNRVNGRKA